MADRARVSSLEAIENFRAKLIVYREKAQRILDEVNDEVLRTRLRLENDWRTKCEGDIKRCNRELEQRQQELFSARISILGDPQYVQQEAVRKVRATLRDTEAKLARIKHWARAYDQRVEAPARQVEKLRHIIGQDLGSGVAVLNETIKTLSAYAEMSPTTSMPKPGETEAEPPAE